MFCAYCGSALPDNAQFCSSCGQKVVMPLGSREDIDKQAQRIVDQLSPSQIEELAKGIADAVLAPLEATLSHLESIAKTGQVTTEDVKGAVKLFLQELGNTLIPPGNNRIILVTFPFVVVNTAESALRRRWFDKKVQGKAKKNLLWEDFVKYAKEETRYSRVEALLRIVETDLKEISVDDELIRYFAKWYGIGIWLEDESLKHLLLAMRLEKVNIPKDVLWVICSRLDWDHPNRSTKILEYVSGVMKYVK